MLPFRKTLSLISGAAIVALTGVVLVATPAVAAPPVIITQPEDTTFVAGGDIELRVEVGGDPAPTVFWQYETGTDVWAQYPAAGNPLRISDSFSRTWRAYVVNADGHVFSDTFRVDLVTWSISLTNPTSVSVTEGDTATFTASATAPVPLDVVWQTGSGVTWTDIPGATSTTLELTNVGLEDNGTQYRARFSAYGGNPWSATSPATLSVTRADFAPVFTAHPADDVVYYGETTSISAAVSGWPVPDVLWQHSPDGTTWTDLPAQGVTFAEDDTTITSWHTFSNVTGEFYVRAVAENSEGRVESVSARVELEPPGPPIIDDFSLEPTVDSGDNAGFWVKVVGMPSPTFTWHILPPGSTTPVLLTETSSNLTLTNVPYSRNGATVTVTATNTHGSDSHDWVLTVNPFGPLITAQPTDASVTSGDDATFSVAVAGDPAPTIQWQSSPAGGTGFSDVPGATGTTLTLASVTTASDGLVVRAIVSSSAGAAPLTSATAGLTVAALGPSITSAPSDVTVLPGGAATFRVTAVGDPAPTFQWQQFDPSALWVDIPGADADTFTTAPLNLGETLQVRVIVSNSEGQVTSAPATALAAAPAPPSGLGATGASDPGDAAGAALLLIVAGLMALSAPRLRGRLRG